MAKERADQLVFEQGLSPSREQAKRLIMAGLVYSRTPKQSAVQVSKPGQFYPVGTCFTVQTKERYVSRGAYKLLTLLDHTNIQIHDLICLDCGASTGGFTDLLLQKGAKRVYTLDVGHHQLHEKLRTDPRVICKEGINIRYASKELIPEAIDFLTCDVSFISLTLILPTCLQWLHATSKLAVLIKPQFEVGAGETIKGVVRDPKKRQQAVDKILNFADQTLHLRCQCLLPSAIKGPKGNQEYIALFVQN